MLSKSSKIDAIHLVRVSVVSLSVSVIGSRKCDKLGRLGFNLEINPEPENDSVGPWYLHFQNLAIREFCLRLIRFHSILGTELEICIRNPHQSLACCRGDPSSAVNVRREIDIDAWCKVGELDVMVGCPFIDSLRIAHITWQTNDAGWGMV